MATEYTRGPWIADTFTRVGLDVRSASGRAVAATYGVCTSIPKTEEGRKAQEKEDRANARLIAAAPDLLQACKEAATLLEQMGHGDLVTAIDLRAAIAKAEGK